MGRSRSPSRDRDRGRKDRRRESKEQDKSRSRSRDRKDRKDRSYSGNRAKGKNGTSTKKKVSKESVSQSPNRRDKKKEKGKTKEKGNQKRSASASRDTQSASKSPEKELPKKERRRKRVPKGQGKKKKKEKKAKEKVPPEKKKKDKKTKSESGSETGSEKEAESSALKSALSEAEKTDSPAARQEAFFKSVDAKQADLVKKLKEFVAIRSAFADRGLGTEMAKAADWLRQQIEDVGGRAWLGDLEDPPLVEGQPNIAKPVVVLANLTTVDPKRKTVLVYGRFGVRNAKEKDGWASNPWVVHEKEKTLAGRGCVSGKGPLLAWIQLQRVMKDLNREPPVNVRLIMEGTDEANAGLGVGLLVRKEAVPGRFLDGVDHVVIADGSWLGKRRPCVIHGARGCAGFQLEVEGSSRDLDAGAHGGVIREPILDCLHLLACLGSPDGAVCVQGLGELAKEPSAECRKQLAAADFDPAEYCEAAGIEEVAQLRFTSREPLLVHRTKKPCFSVQSCGPTAASSDLALPHSARARFSIRLVPNMDPDSAESLVAKHVEKAVRDLGSPNAVTLRAVEKSKPWLADTNSDTVTAMQKAVSRIWGAEPDLICEARSIPAAAILEGATQSNAVALPMGTLDGTVAEVNEQCTTTQLSNAVKVLGIFCDLVKNVDAKDL